MPTGKVQASLLVKKVKAIINSFHEVMKLKKPTTATPGMVSGKTTRQNVRNGPNPSTRAASSNSLGTASKKFFNIQTLNGSAVVAYAITRPKILSSRLSCANKM